MTFPAAAAYFSYNTLRSIWGENPTSANHRAMRAAYHAWQRAEWHRTHG